MLAGLHTTLVSAIDVPMPLVLPWVVVEVTLFVVNHDFFCGHKSPLSFITEATVVLRDFWSPSKLSSSFGSIHFLDSKDVDAVNQLDSKIVVFNVQFHFVVS